MYLSFFQCWKRSLHNVMAFLKLILFYLSLHYGNLYKIMLFFSVRITRIIIVLQPLYFNATLCLQNPRVLQLRGHLRGKLVLPLLDASIPSIQPQFGDMDNFHTFRNRGARQVADPLFRQNWFWGMSYVKKSNPMNLPFIHYDYGLLSWTKQIRYSYLMVFKYTPPRQYFLPPSYHLKYYENRLPLFSGKSSHPCFHFQMLIFRW